VSCSSQHALVGVLSSGDGMPDQDSKIQLNMADGG